MNIFQWLLVHNPKERPSAADLLLSPDMPPPHLENTEFSHIISHTFSKKGSQEYYYLMRTSFNQRTTELGVLRWLAFKDEANSVYVGPANSKSRSLIFSDVISRRFPPMLEIFIRHCQAIGARYFQVHLNNFKSLQRNVIHVGISVLFEYLYSLLCYFQTWL